KSLQWDVGRSDVVDRGERMVIGKFLLSPGAEISKSSMRLDLWNAEARGQLQAGGRTIEWLSFTHANDPVTIIEWRFTGDAASSSSAVQPVKLTFQHSPAVLTR